MSGNDAIVVAAIAVSLAIGFGLAIFGTKSKGGR